MQNRNALTVEQITAIAVEAAMAAVQAALTADQPKAAAPKAPKAPKQAAPKARLTVKCLVRKNRAEFVKAHPWASGLSVYDIAIAHILLGKAFGAGWALGEGYDAKARLATDEAISAVKAHLLSA